MSQLTRWAAVALATAGWLLPASGASAAAPALTLGFTDQSMEYGAESERPPALEELKRARASTIRVMWRWYDIEKVLPPGDAEAQDPAFAGYDFTRLDGVLRDVAAAGVQPLLMVNAAPAWHEGPDRPEVGPAAPRGTWRPDAAAYGRFMTAMARRYTGTFPDPSHPGQALPRVSHWQIWNEPNISVELTPQWVPDGDGQGFQATSPGMYRALLSAGFDAVKAADPANVVVTAGTAPYGEPWAGGPRIPPAQFLRRLLCVEGRSRPRALDCRATPAKFDVLAHHPYPIGPPGRTALNPDDVVVPDFKKLQRPLRVALAKGNVFPKTRTKPIWATETSWDSSPDPAALSLADQAHYAAGLMYVLWRQGVKRLYWFNVRDDAEGAGYDRTLQSGVFFRGATVAEDQPKPSLAAFRFPFVAYRAYKDFRGHGRARLWGMAPAPGAVAVQRRSGGRWRTVARVRARADHVFSLRVSAKRGTRFRAVQAAEASVDAKLF